MIRVDAATSAAQHPGMAVREIPTARELRWPILVVLDQRAEEDPILELPRRVARYLDLAKNAANELDPETGRSLLTQRLMQAIADLYQGGAVDGSDDASRLWITDAGRRLTEVDARGASRHRCLKSQRNRLRPLMTR